MPNENTFAELRLELSITSTSMHAHHEVCFEIKFWNRGKTVLQLPFSNRSLKLEHLGLQFYHRGKRILPTSALLARLKNKQAEMHVIQPGCCWIYELRGTLSDGELVFLGAEYTLVREAKYDIVFEYLGQKASTSWRLPRQSNK